jgi:LacI family transcriptional regulator
MNKRQNKITIVDVATEANVSFGTVSRVINNDIHVKPETRERVQQTMERLNYVVNRQAQKLAGGRSNVIGLLVPDLGTGYIGEIIRGIDSELTISNYDLMLYTTHRTATKEAGYVFSLAQDMVDGLLLVLPRNPVDYTGTMAKNKFPFVLIDHQGTGENCPAVGASNWQGAFNATDYLIQLGHKRIGFITGSLDLGAAIDRLDGYKTAMRTHHIPIDSDLIYEGTFAQPDGYTGTIQFLNLQQPPTAIFASNDCMALGVIDAIRDHGLKIPDDISVIGFDDIPQASLVRPALTTVQQPLEQMGRLATQMLLEILTNTDSKPHRIELPTQLMIRDSTAKPKSSPG